MKMRSVPTGDVARRRKRRRAVLTPAVSSVVGLMLLGGDAGAGQPAGTGDRTSVSIAIDDAGWLPGQVRTAGHRPADLITDPNQNPYHYVDTRGVERTSVLVYMKGGLTTRTAERAGIRNFATQAQARVRYEYNTVLPQVMNLRDIPVATLPALEKMPGVARVVPDEYHPNLLKLDESTPLVRGLQSQLTGAGLPYDGTGVRVCICDTGIDMDHVMYASRIDTAASWDFVNNDADPDDDEGHGSHVAGIAVGGTGIGVDFGCEGLEPLQGMAPGATLIGAKVLNSFGGGTDSDIIAGIDHCADQSPSGGRADVINLSIGTGNFTGTCTHSWAVASNNAVANGVVVVAASGNEGNTNSMGSPACGADVIAVGATYKDDYPNCEDGTSTFNWGICTDHSPARDSIACFSNQSDLLDVAAPGSVIQSASNAAGGNSVTGMSGTSMASPMVAGLAALILDADGTLTPAEVRQIIRDGAIDMGAAGFDRAYGYGRIDVINSLSIISPCSTNADCDDGVWCNGAEVCDAGSCQPGTDPCPGQSCDEAINSCVAAPTMQLEWNMDNDPGWAAQGEWAWGVPSGRGGRHGGPDPTSGATGSNVYGYNLAGDYSNNLSETHLTTMAFDCSNFAEVSVRFQRWLGVEQSTFDHAYLRVSNDGTNWSQVWTNVGEVADTSWSQQTYDISAVADGQPTVYLRWTMGTTDHTWQYCGWNLDDVQIWARVVGGGCQVDADCDDGIPCTTDTCDLVNGCSNTPAHATCDDGNVCTNDTCDVVQGCLNDGTGITAACDDGNACTTGDTCQGDAAGTCAGVDTSATDCDDGITCTIDSCDPVTGCTNAQIDALCDDQNVCTEDTCSATAGCLNDGTGVMSACDDGDVCTTEDSCQGDAAGSCEGVFADSDGDGVCDGLDLCPGGDDTVDNNGNGIPDACDIVTPVPAPPPHNILKNRYISIDPRGANQANVGRSFDIRVTLISSSVNGVTAIGSAWWANEPDGQCVSIVGPTRPATAPNWDVCPVLHLTGCPVIPTSSYEIVAVDGNLASDPPLSAATQAKPGVKWWGDAVGSFDGTHWSPPQGVANIDDILAAIKTWQAPGGFNATHVSVTDIHPSQNGTQINRLVNFDDVFQFVLAFKGGEFPGPAVELCTDP